MLHLEPGVHLEEPSLLVPVHQELDRGRVVERHCLRDSLRVLGKARSGLGRQPGGRRLLDQLLVAPLDRTVAFTERRQIPRPVAEQLDLDVPRADDQLFDVDRPVAERAGRLASGVVERSVQLVRSIDPSHPAPAAAGGGLDKQRKAELVQLRGARILRRNEQSRGHGHPGVDGRATRRELVAKPLHRFRRWADEDEAGGLHRPRRTPRSR